MTKSELWILSEWMVAQDRRTIFHERLVCHRKITPFGEIDLLFAEPPRGQLLNLVEVKTWSGEIWAPHLIGQKQNRRLVRAREYLENTYQRPVRMLLAVVKPSSSTSLIRYFDFPLS